MDDQGAPLDDVIIDNILIWGRDGIEGVSWSGVEIIDQGPPDDNAAAGLVRSYYGNPELVSSVMIELPVGSEVGAIAWDMKASGLGDLPLSVQILGYDYPSNAQGAPMDLGRTTLHPGEFWSAHELVLNDVGVSMQRVELKWTVGVLQVPPWDSVVALDNIVLYRGQP